eukprot:4980226-Amphidinium_carterae.1
MGLWGPTNAFASTLLAASHGMWKDGHPYVGSNRCGLTHRSSNSVIACETTIVRIQSATRRDRP